MPAIDVPFIGNLVLCVTLLCASYAFAMAAGAGRGRPHLLPAARYGTYATCAFVLVAVCLLAFAFQTHDFRIRYVARYSDRSMEWWYLVASLWGGQDGSLLWWAFLLSGWTAACTRWLKGRYLELQPWVLATLMSIIGFFLLLMLFAANPFATSVGAPPSDGEGLNPLLQNYWMIIHPPSLYMGFVGWSIPFAFVVAALVTGRLREEWVHAIRRWMLGAWLFLSIGLILGMLWSYEELGWGGYWAWDPVENASFMPWLVGTAFLHSVIIQERYGMLKVWNVFLICLTFFMTIFGTFLTRSGLIASVHSFARSDIGIWFIYYLVFLFAVCVGLVVWRLPKLKAEHKIDSLVSREFAFLLNNWMFLAFMFAVLGFTMAPLISEWIYGSEITVGPAWYNHWLTPAGLILLFLAGVGPLLSWRKATGKNLMRAFLWPTVTGVVVIVLHFALGGLLGFPAVVEVEPIFDTRVGDLLAALKAVAPVLSTFTCAFVTATIVQEFWRGAAVRVRSKGENPFTAVVRLTSRARRRYGGYIVHVGIVVMYLGFTGAAWDVEKEAALRPGETLEVSRLGDTSRGKRVFRYEDVQMDADRAKRMVFTRMEVLDGEGDELGHVSPAKFIYRTMPEQPTTEVAIRSRPSQDLYVIMSTVDSRTKRGTFRVLLRPLVMWIWIGGLLLIFGTLVAAWPTAREIISGGSSKRGGAGKAAAAAAALLMALGFASGPSIAEAQDSSSLHAGSVVMKNSQERKLFERLLCMCGDCARLPLDTCGCSWAERARVELRGRLSSGDAIAAIMKDYRKEHGDRSIAIPPDEGLGRVMWVVPVVAGALAAGGVVALGRRWRRRGQAAVREDDERDRAPARSSAGLVPGADADDYDARLDEELRQMEDEP